MNKMQTLSMLEKMKSLYLLVLVIIQGVFNLIEAHDAKDFDDTIMYKIDFDMPDFDKNPDLKNHLRTFFTHEKEKYDCLIPVIEELKEEKEANEPELSPITLLQPVFTAQSCSYRIEAYWSYEICHGHHIRQYHEEREGKSVKFQEYYLGKWTEEKTKLLAKAWQENRNNDNKYKTTKIDNTKYPYFEIEMRDGTMCDIINAPRTTLLRYVCYPHAKNDIYSIKEISSCNYESIILTSTLCMNPLFHPEELKEVSIKCYNSPTESHKPLSMLRQELSDLQVSEDDFPISKEANIVAATLARSASNNKDRYVFMTKYGDDVDKLVLELMSGAGVEVETIVQEKVPPPKSPAIPVSDLSPIKDFISGNNCLTGGTSWWKYEFCYGRHVRQFHKDKQSQDELYLGFFSEDAHRQWITENPDKSAKRHGQSVSLWHHYEKGSRCDRTGLPREVDVKLTCTPITSSATTVSMYLLEPKTCQYILVVASPIVCDLVQLADEYGLVHNEKLNELLKQDVLVAEMDLRESSIKTNNEQNSKTNENNLNSKPSTANTINEQIPKETVRA